MTAGRRSASWSVGLLAVAGLLLAACAPSTPARPTAGGTGAQPAQPAANPAANPAAPAASDPFTIARTLSMDELHARALTEGGTLAYYGALAQINAEKILPIFEQRFPGIKVDHTDATSDRLVARVVAEARGGKVLADVFQGQMDYLLQVDRQGLFLQDVPPEAQAYPEELRGKYWVGTEGVFLIAAWNTNLVRPDEAPRQFEDFAHPRWKGRLIAEARDWELLTALAVHKYRSDEPAIELIRKIAANDVEFHRGHSELAEMVLAGQAAACFTCYSHHYPPRMRRGAPVDYLLAEGVGIPSGTAVLKDAPHPYTAMLWARWAASEEGQQAYAEGGRTPAHPNVQPREKTRPERIYWLSTEDVMGMGKYERLWKEIFQLR